jgi:hypothetical protein
MKNKSCILLLLAYCAIWIVCGGSFNPFEWSEGVRAFFTLVSILGIMVWRMDETIRKH